MGPGVKYTVQKFQATFYGRRGVAKFLLSRGADSTIVATNGCTALDLATLVEETDTELLRMLAKKTVEDTPPEIVMPDKRAFLARYLDGFRRNVGNTREDKTSFACSLNKPF